MQKGIESLKKQIELHEEKKEEAKKDGRLELVKYYEKEIELKKKDREKKEKILEK